jgi:hypothetical protein
VARDTPATVGDALDGVIGPAWRLDPVGWRMRLAESAGRLALDESASFLVIRPVEGRPLDQAAIESVWIDGRRVR